MRLIIMQKMMSILIFYKSFIVWSFGINIFLTILSPKIYVLISTKLFLTALIWYFVKAINGHKILKVYRNIGISAFKLFMSIFLIDSLLTLFYLLIIREFI